MPVLITLEYKFTQRIDWIFSDISLKACLVFVVCCLFVLFVCYHCLLLFVFNGGVG